MDWKTGESKSATNIQIAIDWNFGFVIKRE
jgi:hypothetical protein